jgi:molybdate transport system substrate-binding protein
VTQIINGAPADVIATANTDTMAQLTAEGLVDTPQAFCQNKLEIAVAPGNPMNIKTLADLNNPGVKLVIGDPSVPVGEYVTDIEAADSLHFTPVSLQLSDAAVLEQLESGDANAALVFVTDEIGAAGKVTGVPIPAAQNKIGTYEIAAVKASGNLAAAEAFVTSAVSGDIQTALLAAGFLPPPKS